MRLSRPELRLRFRLVWNYGLVGITFIVSAEMRVLRTSAFVGARYGMVSVAAGPNLDIGKLGLERSIDFISDEGKVDIDTSAIALGGHAGFLFNPGEPELWPDISKR